MYKPKTISALSILLFFIMVTSCVKDVDFEQADGLIILQDNSISLIFFDVVSEDFNRPLNPGTIEDGTRLEFLNSSFIADNLNSIEFFFDLENSFLQNIDVNITFLDDTDTELYTINFRADAGSAGSSTKTTFLDVVPMQRVQNITRVTKLRYKLDVVEDGNPIIGALNFRSSTNFVLALGGPSNN